MQHWFDSFVKKTAGDAPSRRGLIIDKSVDQESRQIITRAVLTQDGTQVLRMGSTAQSSISGARQKLRASLQITYRNGV